jgi:hypothetical protein
MFVCDTHFFVALIWLIHYLDNRRSTVLITNHCLFLQFIAHLQVVPTFETLLLNCHTFLYVTQEI